MQLVRMIVFFSLLFISNKSFSLLLIWNKTLTRFFFTSINFSVPMKKLSYLYEDSRDKSKRH